MSEIRFPVQWACEAIRQGDFDLARKYLIQTNVYSSLERKALNNALNYAEAKFPNQPMIWDMAF